MKDIKIVHRDVHINLIQNSWFKVLEYICKGTFFSESIDVFVITPNRRTFFFPETENLNFCGF